MTKTPLIERMQKGGATKAWIKEVEAKDREIERLEQIKVQYLNTIDLLACEKAELAQVSDDKTLIIKARVSEIKDLRSENAALSELLSPLVDVELERDNLKRENLRLNRVDWETIVDAIDIDNPAVKQYAIRCWKLTAEEEDDETE